MDRWIGQGNQRGETLTLEQGWQLGDWYLDRMDANWQRKSVDQIEAFFARVGLTSDFWSLR
ncbi:MAG: hypothetical protein L0Z53_12015 [Acidobacteriales bacterium]|nr:hypothetical protein [Terriglobales bacterium]